MRSHEGNDSGQAIIDVVPARAVTRSKLCFRILFKDAYIPAHLLSKGLHEGIPISKLMRH